MMRRAAFQVAVARALAACPSSIARSLPCLVVAALCSPVRADAVDEALARWDTVLARTLLPPLETADPEDLTRWGQILFLEGDYAGAEEVLSRLSGRRQATTLLRLVRETRARVRGFVQTSSPEGRFVVSFAPGPDEMAVPYLLEAAEAAWKDLSRRFEVTLAPPVRIEIAPTFEVLASLGGLLEEAVRPTGIVALCRYRKVVLVSPAEFPYGYPFADALAHEMVHFFLVARWGEDLPVWFQEGTAKYLETTWRGEPPGTLPSVLRDILWRAIAQGRLIPIHTLTAPLTTMGRAEDVALAYAELSSFVGFLVRTYGPAVLPRLADRLARPGRGDPVVEVTGRSLEALSEAWAREVSAARPSEAQSGTADPLVYLREPDETVEQSLPPAVQAFVRLGDLLRAEGRVEAAAARYRQAHDALHPAHPLVLARLVAALVDAGRPQEALSELERSGLFDDVYPLLARERGRALVLLGRPREALPALLFFARTNPYDPAVHEGLARVWEALGQPTLAERERRLERFWRQ